MAITLQKASAGSGKTYTLTKTFLTLLLTVSDDEKTRLRTDAEIEDQLKHILAVTFTNKATNEMKERITDKLAAIAFAPPFTSKEDEPDYLQDLCELTGSPRQKIVDAAGKALRALLFAYSEFNVSTIDSFFQTILRTFANETDLNDSYQLEIDSDFTAKTGVNTTLDAISSGNTDSISAKWLKILMDNAKKQTPGWNPFQRSESKGSVYLNLFENSKRIGMEDFKTNADALRRYFAGNPDLITTMNDADSGFEKKARKAFEKVEEKAVALLQTFEENGLDPEIYGRQYLAARLNTSLSGDWENRKFTTYPTEGKAPTSVFSSFSKRPDLKKELKEIKKLPYAEVLQQQFEEWNEACIAWQQTLSSPDASIWRIYRKCLPYVPLLHAIDKSIHDYYEQTNTMQISDTNTLLQRIIAQDETPFIYERLGTRINHYLIDEFQDTSRLQWENFYPLLVESESHDFYNLIIGDAKQSIYRFRNADPSIITTAVPRAFSGRITSRGSSRQENTNHRSLRNVVEFNNLFFTFLAKEISNLVATKYAGKKKDDPSVAAWRKLGADLLALYDNVAQYPANQRAPHGYVEVDIFEKPKKDSSSESENSKQEEESDTSDLIYRRLGPLVSSILDRGYSQGDIAFLTRTNKEGTKVVEALMEYNKTLTDPRRHLQFISETSLLISNASSVKFIVEVMRKILSATDRMKSGHATSADAPTESTGEAKKDLPPYLYLLPDTAKEFPDAAQVAEMLGNLQTVGLPSLVEKIALRINEEIRNAEAVYLSAFQDCVLDYCENNDTDIASFLKWWDKQSGKLSVTSPEGSDAINIVSIHKSKGLEYKVVIIPNADFKFLPSRYFVEWNWVKPDPVLPIASRLPPVIPVEVTQDLSGTPHQDLWESVVYLTAMDSLNVSYVAFTRAVNELYILTEVSTDTKEGVTKVSEKNYSIARHLYDFGCDSEDIASKSEEDRRLAEAGYPAHGMQREETDDPDILARFTLGNKLTSDDLDAIRERKKLKKKEPGESSGESITSAVIDRYGITDSHTLEFTDEDDDISDTEDRDPRSTGNLLHSVMEHVRREEDLDRALLRLKVAGKADEDVFNEISTLLHEAVGSVRKKGWFGPEYKVLTERPLLKAGRLATRPDRVMVDREGNAIVLDYKFGEKTMVKRYRRDMEKYVDKLRRTGCYRSVRGVVWYVRASLFDEINN